MAEDQKKHLHPFSSSTGQYFRLEFNEKIPELNKVTLKSYTFSRVSEEIVLLRIRPSDSVLVLNLSASDAYLVHSDNLKLKIPAKCSLEIARVDEKHTFDYFVEMENGAKRLSLHGSLQGVIAPFLSPEIPLDQYQFIIVHIQNQDFKKVLNAIFRATYPPIGQSWKAEFGIAKLSDEIVMIRQPHKIRIQNLSDSATLELIGPKNTTSKIGPKESAVLTNLNVYNCEGWKVKMPTGKFINLKLGVKSVFNL